MFALGLTYPASLMFIRCLTRFGLVTSVFDTTRMDFTLPVLDFVHIGSTTSAHSFA